MELPHIGQHCALTSCNRLDFLPVKCDSCSNVYCVEHYRYETHNCPNAKRKDVQVPVCPLCQEPVAGKRGEPPDLAVSQHIDLICKRNDLLSSKQKQLAREQKATDLKTCSFKKCKQKDLIYLECSDCKCKFCIKHRHPSDHDCSPTTGTRLSAGVGQLATSWHSLRGSCSSGASTSIELLKNKAHQINQSGQAALNRLKSAGAGGGAQTGGSSSAAAVATTTSLQGNLSEQEALAIALSESAAGAPSGAAAAADEDAALARAIHESELEARRRGRATTATGQSQKDTCVLS